MKNVECIWYQRSLFLVIFQLNVCEYVSYKRSFWQSDAALATPTWSSHFYSCCAHVQCYALPIIVTSAELWYRHGPQGQLITLIDLGRP